MAPAQTTPGSEQGAAAVASGSRNRRPNALARFQLKSFRFASSNNVNDNDSKSSNDSGSHTKPPKRGMMRGRGSIAFRSDNNNNGRGNTLLEEGSSLHHHFQTCTSLSRIREEFRATMEDEAENKKMGFGLNCCTKPEESTGRLLAHSIGLNANLIACGGGGGIGMMAGGSTVALSRVSSCELVVLCIRIEIQ